MWIRDVDLEEIIVLPTRVTALIMVQASLIQYAKLISFTINKFALLLVVTHFYQLNTRSKL